MEEDAELILELAKGVLEATSPDEVPIIDAFGEDLLSGVGQGTRGDGALGFGGPDGITLTGVALTAATAAVTVLAQSAAKFALAEGVGLLKRLVQRLRGEPSPDPDEALLSTEELERVRQVAREQALGAGIDDDRAGLIADAIVGRLVAVC